MAGFKSLSTKHLQRSLYLALISTHAYLKRDEAKNIWSTQQINDTPARLENQNLKRHSRKKEKKQRTSVLCLNNFPSSSVTNSLYILIMFMRRKL